MHHEPQLSDVTKQTQIEQLLGPTGRFPGGKLTPNDEGEIAFAVVVMEDKVLINFGAPIASLGLTAKQARRLAALLRRQANEIAPKTESGPTNGRRRRARR